MMRYYLSHQVMVTKLNEIKKKQLNRIITKAINTSQDKNMAGGEDHIMVIFC